MTPAIAYALDVLRAMQASLEGAARTGLAAVGVLPSRAVDTPKQVMAQRTVLPPDPDVPRPKNSVVIDAPFLGVPYTTYALWHDAWSRVARGPWPLGNGEAGLRDPGEAAKLPPVVAALPVLTATLIATQAADWKAPIKPGAIVASAAFLAGAGVALHAMTHRRLS